MLPYVVSWLLVVDSNDNRCGVCGCSPCNIDGQCRADHFWRWLCKLWLKQCSAACISTILWGTSIQISIMYYFVLTQLYVLNTKALWADLAPDADYRSQL